jgi:hypothetical protein
MHGKCGTHMVKWYICCQKQEDIIPLGTQLVTLFELKIRLKVGATGW